MTKNRISFRIDYSRVYLEISFVEKVKGWLHLYFFEALGGYIIKAISKMVEDYIFILMLYIISSIFWYDYSVYKRVGFIKDRAVIIKWKES